MTETIEFAESQYRKNLKYDEAVMYCFTLNIDGKTGWRLPTEEEYDQHMFGNFWYSGMQDVEDYSSLKECCAVRDLVY